VENIGYYSKHVYSWLYPRDKHATVSVLMFRQQDLPAQDEYLEEAQAEYSVKWLKPKSDIFQTEIARTIKLLNAQFHPRGKNRVLECLQFGGNRGKGIGRTGHGRQDHQFRLLVADEPRDMLDHCRRAYGGSSELHDFD